ncbi:MAG: hypothetical protein K6F53_04685 [Lachnospiraceae bacterium]|nr:hypothetical protein [Lachnospiraceae bacterium]
MKELMIDILKALKAYSGMKPFFGLSAAAFLVLFRMEKDPAKRLLFLAFPVAAGLLFLCPLTLYAYGKAGLDTSIYYRILWIIPFGILAAYAMAKLAGEGGAKLKIAVVIISVALIVLSGRFIGSSPVLYPSENIYGLPQTTVKIVDYLRSIDGHKRITVLPSSTTVTSIRQYDANILMPYGRDMFNPALNYYHPVYEAFEKAPVIDVDELLKVSREFDVEYILLYAAKLTDRDPEEAGLIYLTTIDDHKIYRDPVITEKIKEIDRYYENDF